MVKNTSTKNSTNKKGGFNTTYPGVQRGDPSARGVNTRTSGASVRTSGNGITVVSNTERMTLNVSGNSSVSQVPLGFNMNPATADVFPYLSNIANNYELYRWKSLKASYVPICNVQTAGSIEMACFYSREDFVHWFGMGGSTALASMGDYAAGPPYAGGLMSSDKGNRSKADWFGVEFDTRRIHTAIPWLRCDPVSSTTDLQQLSCGAWLALQSYVPVSAPNMGLIYVSYEIEFMHPTAAIFQFEPAAAKVSGLLVSEHHLSKGGLGTSSPVPEDVPLDKQ